MIRTSKVGKHSLRVHARSKGEAVTLARVLNGGEQVRTIGPKNESETRGSLLVVYTSKTARDAAAEIARTAPTFTPVADVPTTEPGLRELDADATNEEGDSTMATKKPKAKARPKRGTTNEEGGNAATKEADAKKKAPAKKKAATKKATAKKKVSTKKKAGGKKKASGKKKAGATPRRGRPPGGGVGELVKTLLRAGKSDAQILASVKRVYPNSAIMARPGPHLAWYRNRVKVENEG